jgi:Flp pilus assembly pilin Flp
MKDVGKVVARVRDSWRRGVCDERGQGVAEYIIILAVIVIAAIVLAIAFHEQLSAVWESVTSSLGELA